MPELSLREMIYQECNKAIAGPVFLAAVKRAMAEVEAERQVASAEATKEFLAAFKKHQEEEEAKFDSQMLAILGNHHAEEAKLPDRTSDTQAVYDATKTLNEV